MSTFNLWFVTVIFYQREKRIAKKTLISRHQNIFYCQFLIFAVMVSVAAERKAKNRVKQRYIKENITKSLQEEYNLFRHVRVGRSGICKSCNILRQCDRNDDKFCSIFAGRHRHDNRRLWITRIQRCTNKRHNSWFLKIFKTLSFKKKLSV